MGLFDFIIKNKIHLMIIYIVLGTIIYQIIRLIINKKTTKLNKKRQKTLQKLIKNIFKYVIIIIIITLILHILGLNITSIVAGLGIASIVIGLALKDLMEDVLAGISIVMEDQYDVGDYVKINGFEGIITDIGLKSTKIKNAENTVQIVANRTITSVTNYSKDNPKITINIPIPYDVDNQKADKVIENIIKRIEKEVQNLKEEVNILGLDEFKDSNITYKIRITTKINEQFSAKRQINRIIKEEFDKENISIPFNIIEVKNG